MFLAIMCDKIAGISVAAGEDFPRKITAWG